jgi:hypothetical protein
MSDNITNEKKRIVGFKVLDHEHNIPQQYADMSNLFHTPLAPD